MKVLEFLQDRFGKEKVHMTLIDPAKQEPPQAGEIGARAAALGSAAIMIGGSTGIAQASLDATVQSIKQSARVPTILFPGNSQGLSRHADALYFLSLLNSRNPEMIVGEQRRAARQVKALGLETIPMGYLIVEPGMEVGAVGEANLIPRDRPELAAEYALAAELFGMRLVYLEAGSGAPDPVPERMIRAVKQELSVPLVVGGGIRTAEGAQRVAKAGADIVVTGTIVEENPDLSILARVIRAVREA